MRLIKQMLATASIKIRVYIMTRYLDNPMIEHILHIDTYAHTTIYDIRKCFTGFIGSGYVSISIQDHKLSSICDEITYSVGELLDRGHKATILFIKTQACIRA
jgi:hypothetical protein